MALPTMTPEDVADRAEDPMVVLDLPAKFVESLLRQARSRVKTVCGAVVERRITTGALDVDEYMDVIARVVMRIVRNPEGYLSETEGNYQYQLRAATGSGVLAFTDDDWRDLRGVGATMRHGTLHSGTHGR